MWSTCLGVNFDLLGFEVFVYSRYLLLLLIMDVCICCRVLTSFVGTGFWVLMNCGWILVVVFCVLLLDG